MAAGNPAQHVYLLGVSQTVSDGIGDYLEQRVGAEVSVVIGRKRRQWKVRTDVSRSSIWEDRFGSVLVTIKQLDE